MQLFFQLTCKADKSDLIINNWKSYFYAIIAPSAIGLLISGIGRSGFEGGIETANRTQSFFTGGLCR